MTADVVISIGIDSSEAKAGADAINRYLDDIAKKMQAGLWGDKVFSTAGTFSSLNDALHKSADSTKRTADAAAAYTTNLARLDYQLGLITRADLEYAEAEARITAALRSNIITADEAATRYAALNAKMDAGTLGANKAGFAFGGMRNVLQQAGWQISDIATVASMGGASIGMLGVQIGQLVGAFGAYGAAAGAAITVGGALADAFLRSADAQEEAERTAKVYQASLKELVDLEKEYNAALRERQGLPTTPDGTKNIRQRVADAEGRLAILNGEDRLTGKVAGGESGTNFVQDYIAWYFRQKGAILDYVSGYDKVRERGSAMSEREQALTNFSTANDVQEATDKERLTKILGDLSDARTRELVATRLATSGHERDAAMLKAEWDVRDKLKSKIEVSKTEIENQAEAARLNAAAIYDMEKAHKDATKAAAESERQQERYRRELEQSARRRAEAIASVEDETKALNERRFAMELTERDAAIYRAGLDAENRLRKAGFDMKDEEVQAAIRARQAAAGATYDKQKEVDRNKPLTEEQLRSMASSFSPNVAADLQIASLEKNRQALIQYGMTDEQVTQEIELANLRKLQSSKEWTDGMEGAFLSYARAARDSGALAARATTSSLNAMENALVSFSMRTATASQAFRAMAASIISDLVRMQVQSQITGPLSSGLSGMFSNMFRSSGGGGMAHNTPTEWAPYGSMTPDVPTFADGGIMTQWGKVPLRTYSAGGIANSPQAAIFGEGSVPEAYVPVPSGKIPVEMRGPTLSPRAEQGGGGGQAVQPVHITTYVEAGANMADVESAVTRGIQAAAPHLITAAVRQSVPMSVSAVQAKVKSDPTFAGNMRGR